MIQKIISGGQTGVDRAALDAGVALNIPTGGTCPRGRRAEDGVIPQQYPLTESPSRNYAVRTEQNIKDSDATLIITGAALTGGTALTRSLAVRLRKPVHVVDLRKGDAKTGLLRWLDENSIETLNIAGPRESQQPGIHDQARDFLTQNLPTD